VEFIENLRMFSSNKSKQFSAYNNYYFTEEAGRNSPKSRKLSAVIHGVMRQRSLNDQICLQCHIYAGAAVTLRLQCRQARIWSAGLKIFTSFTPKLSF